jgi:hypothetical protein
MRSDSRTIEEALVVDEAGLDPAVLHDALRRRQMREVMDAFDDWTLYFSHPGIATF